MNDHAHCPAKIEIARESRSNSLLFKHIKLSDPSWMLIKSKMTCPLPQEIQRGIQNYLLPFVLKAFIDKIQPLSLSWLLGKYIHHQSSHAAELLQANFGSCIVGNQPFYSFWSRGSEMPVCNRRLQELYMWSGTPYHRAALLQLRAVPEASPNLRELHLPV